MKQNRVQLSLIIDDDELFQQFVLPYKDQKALHGLIIKCLSAYYYNEEARNCIEGTSLEDVVDEDVTSTQALCDSIRSSLMMQSFLATELQQTLANGTEDIQNILDRTNTFAEQTGVAKPTTSEYGSYGILKLEANNQQSESTSLTPTTPIKADDSTALLSVIIRALGNIAEKQGNTEVIEMLRGSDETTVTVDESYEEETVSYVEPAQVLMSTDNETIEIFEETVEETTVEDDSDDSGDAEGEDATEALLDLFGSLT